MLNLCSSWTESKKANQPHSVQINPNLTILYQREWSYFPMSHTRLVHTSAYSDQQTCIFLFACEYICIQIKYLSHELMQYLSLSLRFSCINTRLKNAASLQAAAVTSYVILKSSQGYEFTSFKDNTDMTKMIKYSILLVLHVLLYIRQQWYKVLNTCTSKTTQRWQKW